MPAQSTTVRNGFLALPRLTAARTWSQSVTSGELLGGELARQVVEVPGLVGGHDACGRHAPTTIGPSGWLGSTSNPAVFVSRADLGPDLSRSDDRVA